jgi:hypothetical protein
MNCYLKTSRSGHHGLPIGKSALFIGCIGILLFVTNDPSQELKSGQLPAREVPKAAIVEIVLLKAPGIDDKGSRWEIAYEFRVTNEAANEAAFFEARRQGKPEGRVGELIKDADVSKPLRSPENHKFVFEIPLSAEIQERLRNQPKDVKAPPGTRTAEIEKLQREQAIKCQIFKFYSVINIYDARLNKNILIPITQSWDFSNYPDARFGFKIEIKSDGAYSWKTNLPANSRSPVMEIRKP